MASNHADLEREPGDILVASWIEMISEPESEVSRSLQLNFDTALSRAASRSSKNIWSTLS